MMASCRCCRPRALCASVHVSFLPRMSKLCTRLMPASSGVCRVHASAAHPPGTAAAVVKATDLHMLTHALGFTQLDFGFTAYATNSYLKCSPRAALLQRGAWPYERVLSVAGYSALVGAVRYMSLAVYVQARGRCGWRSWTRAPQLREPAQGRAQRRRGTAVPRDSLSAQGRAGALQQRLHGPLETL